MEKTALSTEGNGKSNITSSEIERRIEATREELANTRQMLAKIPRRKAAALSGAVVDEKVLSRVEEDETSLLKRQSYLVERVPILREQLESASAAEAQARLAQLVTESAQCSQEYDKLLAAFHTAAEQFTLISEKLIASFRTIQACHDEQEFLTARYGIAPAVLTGPQSAVPHEDDTAENMLRPLADFWQRQNSLAARNEWSRKLHELQNERRAEQHAQAPAFIPGHVRQTLA